jgi:alpha-L-rhamnosidase
MSGKGSARRGAAVLLVLGLLAAAALLAAPDVAAARTGNEGRGMLVPTALRCEYLVDPTGIEETSPRLEWRLDAVNPEARGLRQSAYRVLVASSPDLLSRDGGDLWDSGRVNSDRTTGIVYQGRPLASRQPAFWKVQVWDQNRAASPWSAPARWSMGLLEMGDWSADWISFRDEAPLHTSREELYLPPTRLYRTEFRLGKPVRRAMLYATALGLYEMRLNGEKVSDSYFTPGWSDYRRRAYYQAFDVTGQLRPGANAVGAEVAEGWYSGYLGYGLLVGYGPHRTGRSFYGKTPALRAQLEIEFEDGSRQVVGTSPAWQVTDQGPTREADMLMGEVYDARRELRGWDAAGFSAVGWRNAIRAAENGSLRAPYVDAAGPREVELGFVAPARLQAYSGPPIRATEELQPVAVTEPQPGVFIFDLGQNFSGVARLQVRGPAGQQVRLRFGEMLHPDGRLMTENLRRARATDTYILRGDPAGETWTPRFTYHGFQYVEVTGYPGTPGPEAITGIAIHSDTPLTSRFECSDPMVNRLFSNVVWTQRANFFEAPTDCPQRDERLGWMGDAQIYVGAATYHADVASFFTKWLDDVAEAQLPNGAFPDYAPYPMFHGGPSGYGTAWMDAGIICPYTVYRAYGDTRVIDRHWDAMKRFMEFRRQRDPMFQGTADGNTWGDWLSLGENTPIEYVDLAYFAHSAVLMAEMASAAGRAAEAGEFRDLSRDVTAAFQRRYLRPDGTLSVDTQTAYALALDFGLIPPDLRSLAAAALAAKIRANEVRMATGFLGTRPLLPVLSAHGHHDLAVRLLQSRRFPSWGYSVANGATSIWERWNSFTKENGFGDAGMNSFSHYAFGAVSEWMFRSLAGIDLQETGYRRLLIRPGPPSPGSNPEHSPIDWVRAEYDSPAGTIRSAWRREGDRFTLELSVPPNTTAEVYLPAGLPVAVREGGNALERAEGVRLLRSEEGRAILEVGSGTYHFESRIAG